jgi:predicted ATPase
MLRSLKLERFKSFENAAMELGPLTILVGTNASGKSNIRDAFRFLHGVARGYALADIFGERFGAGGDRQWGGIRGGLREAAYNDAPTFGIAVAFDFIGIGSGTDSPLKPTYQIQVDVSGTETGPRIAFERFSVASGRPVFEAIKPAPYAPYLITQGGNRMTLRLSDNRPILTQLIDHPDVESHVRSLAQSAMRSLAAMRFLDLSPDAMRFPSIPGQVVLGDRGENLSSVLQAICVDEERKRGLLQWIRELTPMDVVDFAFPADQTGRVLVSLVESSGRQVSAYSASDGTLRFLAILAALLGPESAGFYFLEELENGLHPTRLALLLQLIEQQTSKGSVQVVATTHSAQLLGLLSPSSRSHVIESYRREDGDATDLTPVVSLPDAQRVIAEQGLGRLHASGWIEDAVAFAAPSGE